MRELLLVTCLAIFVSSGASASKSEQPDGRGQAGVTDFNIPPQPLSRALVAYAATTGLELYYNAALAEGRRSEGVSGALPPARALQTLLQGTGLIARMTGPDSFTVVPARPEANPPTPSSDAMQGSYEPYFAAIQARINEALCQGAGDSLEHREILFRVWLAASGVISRLEMLGGAADRANGLVLESAIQGLSINAPPPPDMPQPVTLVIFPPSPASDECAAGDDRLQAH